MLELNGIDVDVERYIFWGPLLHGFLTAWQRLKENMIFIPQTLVSLHNAIFSETIFKGFVKQFLMFLYSRWISMIWIL